MPDMLRAAREEDQRKREEAQFYSIQQQLDETRRQLKENLARQQWFEELYKQNEGKLEHLQIAQDRLTQDIAQTLHVRQIEDGRMKAVIGDLAERVESPERQIRELRAQIVDLADSRKHEANTALEDQKQFDEIYRQMRELNSHIGVVSESQRQLRDLIQELDGKLGEVREEAVHLGELQTREEQRLRRQGIELQELFEALRQQFSEIAARSQRVDEVKRSLNERLDLVDEQLTAIQGTQLTLAHGLEQLENQFNEQYINQQERIETVRVQLDSQLSELRLLGDQRTERYVSRFSGIDERLRAIEQVLGELPSRFEALERRDEMIGSEADTIEEWLVARQIAALESVLDDVRKRRSERSVSMGPRRQDGNVTPGSVYNPSGLLKRVRDAKPPTRNAAEQEKD